MKFWQALSNERTEYLIPLAKACEELGFEGVLLADHIAGHQNTESKYPYDWYEGGTDFVAQVEFPDPFSAICAMAAVTSRLRFNTQIFVAPLRHPVLLSKALATASVISNGRVTLGAGVGWLREEFELLGQDFKTRGRRFDEMIHIMRKLWQGEMVEHHGEFYDFGPLKILPTPISGAVPIMTGGLHPDVLKRAGTLCSGWVSPGSSFDDFPAIFEIIETHREAAGKKSEPFEYIVDTQSFEDIDKYRAYEDKGVAIVNHPVSYSLGPDPSLDELIGAIASFAKKVGISQ